MNSNPFDKLLRRSAVPLIASVLFAPSVCAADDQQPRKTMPIQVTASVKWDVEGGSTRSQGSMTVRLRGTANLAEEVSVMEPGAPPGVMITYGASGVGGQYTYNETVTQEHPPEGCPELLAEYQGGGGFTLEQVTSAMTSGLNIRKVGSMIPKEMMQFVPAQAQEMMIDYYDFFAVAKKQEVRGKKRGFNDCNFVEDTKEFNPSGLTIRFRITEDGKMEGQRRWSVERTSGTPEFAMRVSDLPASMERRPLVPEPGGGSDVTYSLNWNFGDVDPYLEIERREGEFWVPIPGDEPVEVVAGEKMELRGVVHPEEKDPKRGDWTISAEGGSGGETHIKKYEANHRRGEVKHLDPQSDLKKQEVVFYWVDEGTGTVEYKTNAGNKQLKESVEFEIKKPQFAFHTEAKPRNDYGTINVGVGHPGAACCAPMLSAEDQNAADETQRECDELAAKLASLDPDDFENQRGEIPRTRKQMEDLGCTLRGIQYQGISFIAEPQDDITGEVQFVQLFTRSIFQEFEGKETYDRIDNVLDGCYPFPKNLSYYATVDEPGYAEMGGTSFELRQLDFEMYLMFRPDGEDNEWIPLKKVNWNWRGAIRCDLGTCWEEQGEALIPTSEQVPDTSEYPEWSSCKMGL